MGSFKEMLTGLRDAFMQMPMATRGISVGLGVLIALALYLVASGSTTSPSMERMYPTTTLTDDEIVRLTTAFSTSRLNDWEIRQNFVYIPSTNRDEYYLAAEGGNAVPLQAESWRKRMMDDSSPFESNEQRRLRNDHAKEMDLAADIERIPEVHRASVKYDSIDAGFSRVRQQSAVVTVTPMGPEPLPAAIVKDIKRTIKGAYAGISLDAIEVIDVNARGIDTMEEDNPYFRDKLKWEKHYTGKARELLAAFGPLSVQASVELDPTMDSEKFGMKIDPQGFTTAESNSSITHESSKPLSGGAPGMSSEQFPGGGVGSRPNSVEAAALQTSKSSQKNETLQKITGEQYESSKQASLQPTRIKFSIGVPESYYVKLWQASYLATNPTASADTIPPLPEDKRLQLATDTESKIKAALDTLLLPVAAGEDKYPNISVWNHADIPSPPPSAPSPVDTAMTWLAGSWQTLAMFALAIVALLVARGVGKTAGNKRPDFEEGFGLEIPKPPEPEADFAGESGPILTITGQHLKEDLCTLVSKNPEAAANVLRKWLDHDAA